MNDLMTIGEAAKRAGVSVQTLRHYDTLGLLRPSRVTESGYRLYSEADSARLELVRTLRGVGFDLDTIARLTGGKIGPAEAVGLQLEALELQQRTLKRQQTVLKAVLGGEPEAILARLGRMQALARLDKLERESFLTDHLKRAMGGQKGDPEVWRAAVLELPEELNEGQLEAWLELAEIAADPGFQQTLRNQMQPIKGLGERQAEAWVGQVQQLVAHGIQATRESLRPAHPDARALIRGWLEASARTLGRKPGPRFDRWTLKYFRRSHDPRMNRYWELVARLKGWEYTPVYAHAYAWLLDALEAEVEKPVTK